MFGAVDIANVCKALLCCLMLVGFSVSPNISHAAYGTHVDHASHDYASDVDNGELAQNESSVGASGDNLASEFSENCCDGLCLSAVIDNNHSSIPQQSDKCSYLAMDDQSRSFEPLGSIRPPRVMI